MSRVLRRAAEVCYCPGIHSAPPSETTPFHACLGLTSTLHACIKLFWPASAIYVLLSARAEVDFALPCVCFVSARSDPRVHLNVPPTKLFCPQILIGPPQSVSLVPAQDDND